LLARNMNKITSTKQSKLFKHILLVINAIGLDTSYKNKSIIIRLIQDNNTNLILTMSSLLHTYPSTL